MKKSRLLWVLNDDAVRDIKIHLAVGKCCLGSITWGQHVLVRPCFRQISAPAIMYCSLSGLQRSGLMCMTKRGCDAPSGQLQQASACCVPAVAAAGHLHNQKVSSMLLILPAASVDSHDLILSVGKDLYFRTCVLPGPQGIALMHDWHVFLDMKSRACTHRQLSFDLSWQAPQRLSSHRVTDD